ncbi:MAG: tetratricopeptide repeat protein [Candidatus Sumerlaeaceae bacterium]
MNLPTELRTAAWFYSQNPENGPARMRFEDQLAANAHPAILVRLTDQFATLPAVAIPALQRLVDLSPNNVGYLARLGISHYMAGEDDKATSCLNRAREILPDDLEVLNLAATLARDDDSKRAVYARMLELYPDHRAAFENLVVLRKPEE